MKKLITTICVTMLLLLAGCFDYDETLVLNEDGSGAIQMKFGIDKAYFEQIKMIQEQLAAVMPGAGTAEDPMDAMFSREQIEKSLARDDSGVKLLSYEKSETEKSQVWDMKFSFTDWQKLIFLYDALSSDSGQVDEYVEQTEDEAPMFTRQDDGTWLFFRILDIMDGGEDDVDEEEYGEYYQADDNDIEDSDHDLSDFDSEEYTQLAEDIEAGMEQMAEQFSQLGGSPGEHKMRFSVTFPGEIIESNAHTVDGKTAVWEYKLEQLGGSPPDQRVVFKWNR